MSNNKQVFSNLVGKKRFTQIIVAIVLLAFAAYFIVPNLLTHKTETDTQLDNSAKNTPADSFTKEGELSFLSEKGTTISQLNIEVADDEAQKQKGLMFRDKMEQNQGMIFLFDKEEPQAFWMHNTILSLDIIYINSKMEIVHIAKNAKPFDDTSLPSVKPAQYVVEVNGGYTDKLGIKEGDKIVWRRI
jgi:uncharacterized protein